MLVVRVHPENLERQKLPEAAKGGDVWKRRYREINDWERYLTDNGFRIVKLFLNLSREEQRAALPTPDRSARPQLEVLHGGRPGARYWDEYQKAFSDVLTHTSTAWAPWYVIPADRKWFERLSVGMVLAHTLVGIDPRYPKVSKQRHDALLEVKQALAGAGPQGGGRRPLLGRSAQMASQRPRNRHDDRDDGVSGRATL